MSDDTLPADFAHAQIFRQRLQAIYGSARAARAITAMAADTEDCFWVNPLVDGDAAAVLAAASPVAGVDGLWRLARTYGLSRDPLAACGRLYIQNASSYFAAACLQVLPDEEVLDLAAAPGSKTVALAAAMGNSGRLAAVEPVKARFQRLRANLQRCGVSNAVLYMRDGRGVGRAVPERFDRVLVDAPCSSESHMRWHDARTYRHWSLRKVKECQRKQKGLLRSGYAALKPGGTLVYSTCSFSPEENEAVVQDLLRRSDACLVPLAAERQPHFAAGLTSWGKQTFESRLSGTLRILPAGVWDGFYVAKVSKPAA